MNKILANFIKILASLLSLRFIQCKICPTINTSYIPMFDNGYYIRSFFRIPYTNLLVINAYYKTNESSSIVYYSDLTTTNADIINVVQPDFTIIEMSYIYGQDKILAMNYDKIVIANPYTLKGERYLPIPQLIQCLVIDRTTYAVATLKRYVIYIIDLRTLTVTLTLDNRKQLNVTNTQNFYSKFFTRLFPQTYLIITVNSFGFFSWFVDLNIKDQKYYGYITPTIVNSTVSADFANRQFTKHPTKDIFFVGALNLEILAFEIVDLNTQNYRQQMKLNLYNSQYKFNVNNILYKLSTEDSTKPVLIIGDGQYIYDLPLTFDTVNNVITIPSWKAPTYVFDKNLTSYVWYELPDQAVEQRIVMSANYTVTLYNYYTHTYSYILYFGTDWQSKRFLYEENGQSYFAALSFKDKSAGSIYYYKRSSQAKYNGMTAKLPYQTYQEVNNIYRVKNCSECLITKVAESATTNHFMTQTIMYPIANTNTQILNITSLGFKWSDVNLNLDPFRNTSTKDTWVVFGFRNKTADKKYLFTMINMNNTAQNINLAAASDEENSRKSSYAIAAVEDPDNLEIIGVDLLGYIYVWDYQNPKTIKYSRKVTFNNTDCLNSDIGTIYQQNKQKWLILSCDDLRILVYDFQNNITSKIQKSTIGQEIDSVSSNPLSLRAFSNVKLIAIGDTLKGIVYICKFDEISNLFYLFLIIQPGNYLDRVLSIELLKDNSTIWVQYQYSNLFYTIGDCLNDVKDCLSCQQNYYFNTVSQYDSSYAFGIGTEARPFTTASCLLNAVMLALRYQNRISGITGIGINLIVDPQYYLNLPKDFLTFDFSQIIELTIKSKIENQQATLEFPDRFEFKNYRYVGLKDIKVRYYFTKRPNVCSLNFVNISQNVTLNNIFLYNYTQSKDQQNCFQIYADQAVITISNIILQGQDFSTHTYLISTLNANSINIQNLSFDSCTFGDDFSILQQSSNLIATLKNIKINNSKCINSLSGSVSSLFYSGLFNVEDIQIQNNTFCNKIIFTSVPTLDQNNYQFQFKQVQVQDNKFITKNSYLFFNSLYSMREKPSHSAQFLSMIVQNNTILQNKLTDLTKASFIQTNKIQNHIFQDIIFKNHHEITFSTIEYSDNINIIKFDCLNDQEYFDQISDSDSGRCLQLYEIQKTKIQTIRINYKKTYNYELINLKNKLFNKNSEFEVIDGQFSNMQLNQNIQNIYANPFTIYGQNELKVTFSDCHFFDNSLEIFEGEQAFSTFSTSAIWIANSLGTVSIKDSTFKNSNSNSIYNFIFIETNQLDLQNIEFENSSFQLETTKQRGGFMYLKISTLKILDSSFSKSKAYQGSFIYIESYGNLLKIDINNANFSEGHAEVDGGAFFIDIGKSKLEFTCTDCFFDNIYTYTYSSISTSSAIGFQKYRITTNSIIHQMQYKGGHFRNIFGVEDNFFIDIFNMNLSFIDIKEIKPLIIDPQEPGSIMNKQFGKYASQQSTLINSLYSEIYIKSCNIQDAKIQNINSKVPLYISSEFTKVNIIDSVLQDGTFVKSAIKVTNGTLTLQNTQFNNIVQLQKRQRFLLVQLQKLQRFLQVSDSNQANYASSLIVIQDSSLIISEETSFIGTKCNNCKGAVFYLMNTNFDISDMNISNSEAKYGGSLYIEGLKLENKIISSKFQNNVAQNDGGAIYLQALKDDKFILRIENSEILQNNAVSGKGGAIFINSTAQNSEFQLIEIYDSQFIGNVAQIGGGIYEKAISPKILGNSIFKENVGKTFGNDTLSYPTHLRFSSMNTFFSQFEAKKVEDNHIVISNFRSGNTLTNLTFELVNDQDEVIRPITEQEQSDFTVQVQIAKNERFDNYSMRKNTSAHYDLNLTKQFVFLDFDFIGIPGSEATLEFKSDQIYILDKNKVNQYHQDYSFKLTINLRNCIQGEATKKYNYLTECIYCLSGKYSFDLQDCQNCPDGATCAGGAQMVANYGYWRKTNESSLLLECSSKVNCPGGSFGDHICFEGHIGALCEECDIMGQYWNTSYTKSAKNSCTRCDQIVHNSWFVLFVTLWTLASMALAIRGDIQAKLQQGSIHAFNLRKQIRQKTQSNFNGQSQMLQESSQVPVDNLLTKSKQLKKSMISSSYQNTHKDQSFVRNLSQKMQQKNGSQIKKSDKKTFADDRSGIYIKILTNYFQIVSSIATFNLNIPSGIFEVPSLVGQPLKSTMKSLDCILKDYQTQIPYIYLRVSYSLLLPVAYFLIFLLVLSAKQLFNRKNRFPWYILSTAIMFLIIYVQPDLVAEMIALMSCRKIGDTQYILSNVSYECYTSTHSKYVLFLIAPLLSTWVLILPLVLFLLLYKNKEDLSKFKIKMKYGFLYKEYKKEAFYWEFVKIVEKICIILSLNFYSTNVIIKAVLVFIVIVIYGILSIIIEPYEEQSINTLDIHSTNVCALTVLLGLFIYQNPFPYFYYTSFGAIIVINSLFLLMMLKRIVNIYIKRIEAMLQAHMKKLAQKVPTLKAYLQSIEDKKKINPVVKQKVKRIFDNYMSMTIEERQKVKINILKSNFKYTLSNMFGELDDSIQNLKNSKSERYANNKFKLFSVYDEKNNLLTQNQNFSPLLHPIYTMEEDNVNYTDEENHQRRIFARHSVLADFKLDEITGKPLETEQCEVAVEEVKGDWSSYANYKSKETNMLQSLNNQTTEFQVFSPIMNSTPIPLLSTFSDQVKQHDDDNENNQQKRALSRFSVLDNFKIDNEINLEPTNQEYCDIDDESSKIDNESRDSYQSKEIKLLCSLNNELAYQDEILDEKIKEESQIGESNIDDSQKRDKQLIESQIGESQVLESEISAKIKEQQEKNQYISESQIQENKQENEKQKEEEEEDIIKDDPNVNDDSISEQEFNLVKVDTFENIPDQSEQQ